MSRITDSFVVKKYTILGLDSDPPRDWNGNKVQIEGHIYTTEIVFDVPHTIGIIAHGDFKGKEITFV